MATAADETHTCWIDVGLTVNIPKHKIIIIINRRMSSHSDLKHKGDTASDN
jgi:hypothetical protein